MGREEELFVQIMEETAARDPVACDGCTACCRGNQSVAMKPELGDDPKLYEGNLAWEKLGPREPMSLVLKRQENGDCIYLRRGKCKVYDRRPVVCRAFDCRRTYAMFTPTQRAEATRCGVFPQMVWDAAAARIHTMTLSEEEKRVIGHVGTHVIQRSRA